MYDTKSNEWKALPKLATPRGWCAAVIYGKQEVYAIAGYGNNSASINSVERLLIFGNGSWENVVIS